MFIFVFSRGQSPSSQPQSLCWHRQSTQSPGPFLQRTICITEGGAPCILWETPRYPSNTSIPTRHESGTSSRRAFPCTHLFCIMFMIDPGRGCCLPSWTYLDGSCGWHSLLLDGHHGHWFPCPGWSLQTVGRSSTTLHGAVFHLRLLVKGPHLSGKCPDHWSVCHQTIN